MSKTKVATRLAANTAFACCLLSAVLSASAQQPTHPPSPAWQTARIHVQAKATALPDIVAQLAHQLHCSIIMDDAPILPPPDLDCDGTGKEVLDKVCDAYDYSWKVSKQGMVLLTKRFRNPDEQPQMRLAELQQMAHDVLTALSGVTCDPRPYQWPHDCQMLYESCTIRQLETLKMGGPVNFGELSAAQQATLTEISMNHRFAKIISSWKGFSQQQHCRIGFDAG